MALRNDGLSSTDLPRALTRSEKDFGSFTQAGKQSPAHERIGALAIDEPHNGNGLGRRHCNAGKIGPFVVAEQRPDRISRRGDDIARAHWDKLNLHAVWNARMAGARPDHSQKGSALDQHQQRIANLSDAALSRRQRRRFSARAACSSCAGPDRRRTASIRCRAGRGTRETLEAAVIREVREETGLDIEPLELAGYRQMIVRDAGGKIARHFVILPFAARWISGEISLNEELAEASWLLPSELSGLKTTEGLAEIVAAAGARLAARR